MKITTPEERRARKRKHAIRAAVLGFVLALICHALPHEYQTPCATVIKLCTGG
jgi:hypothetical protein